MPIAKARKETMKAHRAICFANRNYRARKDMIESVVENTILNGWTPGLGPNGIPYALCKMELMSTKQHLSLERTIPVDSPIPILSDKYNLS